MGMAQEIVGEVSVRVRPDGSQFGPDLQAILNRATNQASAGGQAIGNALGQASKGADQLGQSLQNNVGQQFANAAVQAAGFTAAVYATKAAIQGTVGQLAGLFDQLAQARAGFNAIIGERQGTRLLADIREFARVSPFVTQELVNYSQQLLGVGLSAEKIVPLLRDTGNVIASVGGDTQNLSRVLFTMTQIQTVGRLTGQDAMQLQSALIPITKMLATYLGKTTQEVKKLQEQGTISAETVFAAIQAAGQKVPGAMDNAVRNIAGARAVLSDSIKILLQDAPALNKVYTDIVQGIQTFATKLSDPAVAGVIAKALESVGRAYEELKPVIQGFMELAGSASLTGLKTFGTILELVSDVLSAFPKSVLESLGKVLAVMATLQAPRYLLQYVTSLRTMAGIFTTGGGGLVRNLVGTNEAMTNGGRIARSASATNMQLAVSLRQVGSQAALTAAQVETLNAAWAGQSAASGGGKFKNFMRQNGGTIATVGAGLAGQYLQSRSPTDQSSQALGGALTYGAMGFAVAGAPGAVAGAGIGALTGYIGASEEKARQHVAKMKELGQAAATEFVEANKDTLTTATAESARLIDEQMKQTYSRYMDRQSSLGLGSGLAFTKVGSEKNKALSPLSEELVALRKVQDDLFGGIEENIRKTQAALSDPRIQAVFTGEFLNQGNNGRQGTSALKSWDDLEKAGSRYGLTLAEIGSIGAEAFSKIVIQINNLNTETQKAISLAGTFNAAFEKSKGEADAIYGVRGKELANRLSLVNAEKAAIQATSEAYQNQGDVAAQMAAQQAVFQAAELAYQVAKADALARNKTEAEATAAAELAGNNIVNKSRVVGLQTMQQLAAQYGFTQQQLATILNLEKALDPAIKIVVTADTADALAKLATLIAMQQTLLSAKPGDNYSTPDTIDARNALLQQQIDAIKNQFGMVSPAIITPGASPATKTPTATGPTFADKLVSAGDSLKNALLAASSAVEQAAAAWKGSIKESTQYEASVSASRALKNTGRQITDIQTITTGIATLKARGLSEAAINALDINALTDARQVKKLLATDPAKLKALSAAVGQRDLLASTLSSSRQAEQSRKTITQAILEAAKLLGYTVTPDQARAISAEFNITSTLDATAVADSILNQLSGGRVVF